MKWEDKTGEHSSGERLMLGKYKVGEYYHNGSRRRNDPKRYRVLCVLPGINSVLGDYEEVQSAKGRLERAVAHWIENAGLAHRGE